MKSEVLPWEMMRRIHLLTIKHQEAQENVVLQEMMHEIQETSLVMNIYLKRHSSARGRIVWEIMSKDIESLRTELSLICAKEGMDVEESNKLQIHLFVSKERAMEYPKISFKMNFRLSVRFNPSQPVESYTEANVSKGVTTEISSESELTRIDKDCTRFGK